MKSRKRTEDGEREDVPVSRVTALATGLMLDYLFVSLCRHFKEGNLEEFSEILSVFQSICQCASLKGDTLDEQKFMISALMARVMHAKQLDVMFEEDEKVLPLMSAARVWSQLKVPDEDQFKNILTLLIVQSVAVCLTNGERSSATSALKWFESRPDFPQNIRVKLTTVVEKGDVDNPLLVSYNFNRLMAAIQSFVDSYLKRNPCDFIIKESTKMVRKSQKTDGCDDTRTPKSEGTAEKSGNCNAEKAETTTTTTALKSKRKLLSTKTQELLNTASPKKPCISLSRISMDELRQQLVPTQKSDTVYPAKKRRTHQKWTWEQDKLLKKGVKHFGLGKWTCILSAYDFGDRTGVMLKDRWRVLGAPYTKS